MKSSNSNRLRITATSFIAILIGCYILLSYVQRAIYVFWIVASTHQFPQHLIQALATGLLFDLAAALYLFLPASLLLLLVPSRFEQRSWLKAIITAFTLFPLVLTTSSAIGEIFFFDEFHARYNFIAVDYLIYTTEVARNVLESYPLPLLAAGAIIPTFAFIIILRNLLARMDLSLRLTRRQQLQRAFAAVAMILCAAFVSEGAVLADEPYWPRELSKNSLFTLFSAYKHNSIDYKEFYSSLDPQQALHILRGSLHGRLIESADVIREINSTGKEKKLNVVLVAMESMSARFLAHYGNTNPITPNLDRLADAGLFYSNFYATGTRTVRGLEALMLSLPPTPGQSILRRPGSDRMFNLASVFSGHGYRSQFVYGGYAYFDNMREWFESNGFEVVDRGQFPSAEIHFGNAWGVCDEDLFDQVIKQEAAITGEGKPFFQVVLTTSNHRPYTFPEGRIDIPSHSGRDGAIKYSDYSIGKFIEAEQKQPWFKDTIFIFVADHDASVAGGTDIPVHDYLIPAIFYSPGNIPNEKIGKLASQIDLAPTLLGLLDFSYRSKFFGENLLITDPNRALLGTYQKVARLEPHQMTILAPGRSIETQELDDNYNLKKSTSVIAKDPASIPRSAIETIAIYQSASELFAQGQLKSDIGTVVKTKF